MFDCISYYFEQTLKLFKTKCICFQFQNALSLILSIPVWSMRLCQFLSPASISINSYLSQAFLSIPVGSKHLYPFWIEMLSEASIPINSCLKHASLSIPVWSKYQYQSLSEIRDVIVPQFFWYSAKSVILKTADEVKTFMKS